MNSITREVKISVFVLFGALFVSSVILAQAQTDANSGASATSTVSPAPQGITFPIPELGNCGSKDECRNYCNAPEHMEACIAFAKAHGLMNKDEASQADNFRKTLQANGGPGGCTTPESCKAFCSDVKNLDVCLKFAQDHGLKNPESDRAQKILTFLKNGGTLPGGCTSKETCEAYCSDFSHAEECQTFAMKTGITETEKNGIPPGQFQKFLEFVKNGQTPGGCKSKDECESYCRSDAHFKECIEFGKKIGFVSEDNASKLEQLGGKGPGGCDSPEACSAFCNDAAHQQECFQFAKDHNLIPQEQLDQAKNGLVRVREGLSQAPPEVAACLNAQLGQGTLDQIQAGTLTPGPELAKELHGCFEKFGHRSDPGEVFKNAPVDVTACLKGKLGADFDSLRAGQTAPTPEMADTFRVCFQQHEFEQEQRPEHEKPGSFDQEMQGHAPSPADFLRSAPPGIANCLQQKLGDEFDKLKSGETSQLDSATKDTVRGCLQDFKPGMMPQKPEMPQEQENQGEQGQKGPGAQAPGQFRQQGFSSSFPPGVADCLKQKIGADAFANAQNGETSAALKEAMQSCMQQGGGMMPEMHPMPGGSSSAPFRFPQGDEGGIRPKPYGGPSSTDQYHPPFDQPDYFKSGSQMNTQYPPASQSSGMVPQTPQSGSPDPATMCAKSGGTWTGSTCQMPSSPQPSSQMQQPQPQPEQTGNQTQYQNQYPSQPFPTQTFQPPSSQPPPPSSSQPPPPPGQ